METFVDYSRYTVCPFHGQNIFALLHYCLVCIDSRVMLHCIHSLCTLHCALINVHVVIPECWPHNMSLSVTLWEEFIERRMVSCDLLTSWSMHQPQRPCQISFHRKRLQRGLIVNVQTLCSEGPTEEWAALQEHVHNTNTSGTHWDKE